MPDVCIVAVCQNSGTRDRCWNQSSRPIDSRNGIRLVVVGRREGIEFSNFGRRLEGFASIMVVTLIPHMASLVSPCPLRMAGKSMYKHDTFVVSK